MTHTLKSLLSVRAIFVVLAVLAVLYIFFGSMNGITTAGKALQNRAESYVASGLGDEFRLDQADCSSCTGSYNAANQCSVSRLCTFSNNK